MKKSSRSGEENRDLIREKYGDQMVSPEESDRRLQERGGAVTVTFVKLDPKTGKRPTLTIIDTFQEIPEEEEEK